VYLGVGSWVYVVRGRVGVCSLKRVCLCVCVYVCVCTRASAQVCV